MRFIDRILPFRPVLSALVIMASVGAWAYGRPGRESVLSSDAGHHIDRYMSEVVGAERLQATIDAIGSDSIMAMRRRMEQAVAVEAFHFSWSSRVRDRRPALAVVSSITVRNSGPDTIVSLQLEQSKGTSRGVESEGAVRLIPWATRIHNRPIAPGERVTLADTFSQPLQMVRGVGPDEVGKLQSEPPGIAFQAVQVITRRGGQQQASMYVPLVVPSSDESR